MHCGSIKNVLTLGIVQSSRTSTRRADASNERPARRIAGGEALFQGFVDLVFGRRSNQHLRLALAPRNRGPMLCSGSGHHVTGRIPGVAADATGARGPHAVVVLMIHLPLAPAHGCERRRACAAGLNRPRWARFEVNALSRRLTSPRLVRRPQAVADAGLGQNIVRALGIGFDLLPELAHIDAQILCVGEVIPPSLGTQAQQSR